MCTNIDYKAEPPTQSIAWKIMLKENGRLFSLYACKSLPGLTARTIEKLSEAMPYLNKRYPYQLHYKATISDDAITEIEGQALEGFHVFLKEDEARYERDIHIHRVVLVEVLVEGFLFRGKDSVGNDVTTYRSVTPLRVVS